MIGIYKITNKENGKCYIGQSNNIERRFAEHKSKGLSSGIPVDVAIQKYGKDSFLYEVLEECSIAELNQREKYWIEYYQSHIIGYNCSVGGDQQSVGTNNGRAKLTDEDIIFIRKAYNNHLKQKDVYKQFEDKIFFLTFKIYGKVEFGHILCQKYLRKRIKNIICMKLVKVVNLKLLFLLMMKLCNYVKHM